MSELYQSHSQPSGDASCREAMPLLRYGTHLACSAERLECACGRSGIALRPGARLDVQAPVRYVSALG